MTCRLESHREFRIHLTKDHFYCFCSVHFKVLQDDNVKMGFTTNLRMDSHPCEIPWCDRKRVREVYPTNKKIVSFWQPRRAL